jgi:hypothetical protein
MPLIVYHLLLSQRPQDAGTNGAAGRQPHRALQTSEVMSQNGREDFLSL